MSASRWRLAALRARRIAAVVVLRCLMAITPPRRQALVAGLPDWEENALAVAVGLARGYPGRVVLVAADPAGACDVLHRVAAVLGAPDAAGRVDIVAKSARAAFTAFWRSELVCYTHGLFDSPRPVCRRVHVNLWHGSGPKWNANTNIAQRIGADALATASTTWGPEIVRALRMPAGTRLLPGNPRQDVMLATADRSQLAALGLDPAKPVVLWMPTFRVSASAGRVGLSEGGPLGADPGARALAAAAAERGVQLVLKTHHRDDDDYAALGLATVTTEQILAAGLTLYQVVGLADGLVSDYSSVWVDYLATGRSVGLYCPDLERYERERGLNRPGLRDVAAGLLLDDAGIPEFFAAVSAGRPFRPDAHAATVEALGVDTGRGSRTGALLDAVAGLGQERYGAAFGLAATES